MFKGENHADQWFSLCCSRGEVKLLLLKDSPEVLKKLQTGNSQRDRDKGISFKFSICINVLDGTGIHIQEQRAILLQNKW